MNQQSSHLMLEIILLCLHDWRERIPLLHSPPRSCLTDFHPLVAFLIIILFFKHVAKRGFIFQLSSGEDLKKKKSESSHRRECCRLVCWSIFCLCSRVKRSTPTLKALLKMCSRFCDFTSTFALLLVRNDVPSLTLEAVLAFIRCRGESHFESEVRTRTYKHGFVNLLLIVRCDVETRSLFQSDFFSRVGWGQRRETMQLWPNDK